MNRAQRRALGQRGPIPASVTLRGGPMDAWVVTPDAECLQSNWWETWPPTVKMKYSPGRYSLDAVTMVAEWRELGSVQ